MYQELLQLELNFLKFERVLCEALSQIDFRLWSSIGEIKDNITALETLLSKTEHTRTQEEIEKTLSASYRCRILHWDEICAIPCGIIADFEKQLVNLSSVLDALIIKTNLCGELKADEGESFVERLRITSRALQREVAIYIESHEWQTIGLSNAVQLFFGDLFPRALYWQKRIIFWQSWQKFFNEAVAKIKHQTNKTTENPGGILDILAIKKLLGSAKRQFFLSIYRMAGDRPDVALARNVMAAHRAGIIKPRDLVDRLEQSFAKLRLEITKQEQDLEKYGLLRGAIAEGMYFWTESYYFKFAESYFMLLNDLSADSKLTQVPILGVKLTDNYLSFFTTLGSVLLLEVDSRFIGLIGISCALFNTMSQFLLSDLENIIELTQGILDESQIVSALPYVEQLLGLGLNILLYSIVFGANVSTIRMLATGFLAANACRKLVGSIMDWIHRPESQNERSWELFVKQPVQHVASVAAYYFVGKATLKFFPPTVTREQLLADEELCLQEAQKCKKAALEDFGLPENAKTEEIKEAFRQLALVYHPDRMHTTDSSQMIRLFRAKELLEKLDEFSSIKKEL